MDRLTRKKRYDGGIPHDYWSAEKKDVLVQRLGKYEDLGMDPETILRLATSNPKTLNTTGVKTVSRYYVIKNGKLEASCATYKDALDLIETYSSCDPKHYILKPEYSIIFGVQEFIR